MSAVGPHPGRLARLRAALRARGVSSVLVTHLPNIRWLCGFSGSAGSLLVTGRDAVLFSDFRYRAQVRREVRAARFLEFSGGVVVAIAAVVRRSRIARLGFEPERMSVAHHADLTSNLRGVEFVPLRGVVEELRAIKDPGEIREIRRALAVAGRALAASTRRLAGQDEITVASRLQAAIKEHGGDGESFPTIVASGLRGALPHAVPTRRIIKAGDLAVVDFGVRSNGYCCDVTRTFHPGKWDEMSKKIYEIVLESQSAALETIRPGIKAGDVDEAARKVIEKAGYGEHFGHGTGHGVGLEVHEKPTISSNCGDILQPGMIFTVEPGIYIENFGGVRIEDMVLVTEHGREVLSRNIPKLLGS